MLKAGRASEAKLQLYKAVQICAAKLGQDHRLTVHAKHELSLCDALQSSSPADNTFIFGLPAIEPV